MRYFPVLFYLILANSPANAQVNSPINRQSSIPECIAAAAQYHAVNQEILTSVLHIESPNFDPDQSIQNSDRSVDRGLGGINSVHDSELSRHAISPKDLYNPCVSIYTAGWLLKRAVTRYGETWFGYASYHSATPYFNQRYQILIHNDLVRRGAKSGVILKVPPLKPVRDKSK